MSGSYNNSSEVFFIGMSERGFEIYKNRECLGMVFGDLGETVENGVVQVSRGLDSPEDVKLEMGRYSKIWGIHPRFMGAYAHGVSESIRRIRL